MQDRYAGDIADFVKFALLRALMPGRQVGLGWWLHPDESHNGDGRHITYLAHPEIWRPIDPLLFDALRGYIAQGDRSVAGLRALDLVPGIVEHHARLTITGTPAVLRRTRAAWFDGVERDLAGCDLVFLDPDNGLEPGGFSAGSRRAGKSIALAELRRLAAPGRTIIVYHHQTRMRGGHVVELDHWARRLRGTGFGRVDAVRASAYCARAFFVLDASDDVRRTIVKQVERWATPKICWHGELGCD